MSNNSDVLKELKKQISEIEKLKIAEAQELYKKAISTSDTKLRKLYMDKLVLGTLYVIYDYIERNQIYLFSSVVYGVEDIVSSFTETWIEKVSNGELLNVDRYSLLLTSTFFSGVYNKLGGQEIVINELYGLSIDQFIQSFIKFIELKNQEKKLTQEDLIVNFWGEDYKKYFDYVYKFISFSVINLFEGIYNNLELDKEDNLQLGKTKIYNFLKVILSAGFTDSLSDEYEEQNNMEEDLIDNIFYENLNNNVDKELKDDRARGIIHKKYGLDDGQPQTLEQISKIYNISIGRVRQIEAKAIRKLRYSNNIRSMFKGE